jgi:hypothetical protein
LIRLKLKSKPEKEAMESLLFDEKNMFLLGAQPGGMAGKEVRLY